MARDVKDPQWYNNPRPLFYSYPQHNNFYDSQLHNSYPNANEIRPRNLGYSDGNQYYYHQMSGDFYQNYYHLPLVWPGRTNMGLHNYYYPMPYQQNTTSNHIRVVDERTIPLPQGNSPLARETSSHEREIVDDAATLARENTDSSGQETRGDEELGLARDGKSVELSEEAEPLDLKAMRVSLEEVINDEEESTKICVVCQQDLVCDDDDEDDDDGDGEDDDDDEYDDDDEDEDDEYEDNDEDDDDDDDDEDYGDDEDEDDDHQRRIEVLECGHEFHGCCISRWLKYRNLCPLCKRTGGVRGG